MADDNGFGLGVDLESAFKNILPDSGAPAATPGFNPVAGRTPAATIDPTAVALRNVQEAKENAALTSVENANELLASMETNVANIQIAQKNIAEKGDHIFAPLLENFDDSYNVRKQQQRIQLATSNIELSKQIANVKSLTSQANVNLAMAPLEFQQQMHKVLKGKFDLKNSQVVAMRENHKFKNELEVDAFENMHPALVKEIAKTGKYNNVATAGRVNKFLQAQEATNTGLASSAIALKSSQLELAQKMEAQTLDNMPPAYGNMLLADQPDAQIIQFPGGGQISRFKLESKMQKRKLESDKRMEENALFAANQAKTSLQSNVISTQLNSIIGVAGFGSGAKLPTRLTMDNLSAEQTEEIDLSGLPIQLQAQQQQILQVQGNINDLDVKGEDSSLAVKALDELKKQQIVDAKKWSDDFIASKPKDLKPAFQEFMQFGEIRTEASSNSIILSQGSVLPAFTNPHLDSAYTAMQESFAQERNITVGVDEDLSDDERTARANRLMQQAFSTVKATNEDALRKSFLVENSKGQTPASIAVNSMVGEAARAALVDLGKDFPEITAQLNNPEFTNNESGKFDITIVSKNLAQMSFFLQKQNPDITNDFYGEKLAAHLNTAVKARQDSWNTQGSPEQSAFMTRLFNRPPSEIVDRVLQTQLMNRLPQIWAETRERLTPNQGINEEAVSRSGPTFRKLRSIQASEEQFPLPTQGQ